MTNSMEPEKLSSLLDILTHHRMYSEIQQLREPGCLASSGAPWKLDADKEHTAIPMLSTLFGWYMSVLPGAKDISQECWQERIQILMNDMAVEGLSDTYEAGYIGIRKTLATAASSILEIPAKAYYTGLEPQPKHKPNQDYDLNDPQDVILAFDDALQDMVYGDGIDKLFDAWTKSPHMADQEPMIRGADEFITMILASMLHYMFVIHPNGAAIFNIMKLGNTLTPWLAVKSTLKIGNVASMMNGLINILLAKTNVNGLTSMVGLTKANDAGSGLNLQQLMVSTIANWDCSSMKSKASKLKKDANAPTKEQRLILEKYVETSTQNQRHVIHMKSERSAEPVVVSIMEFYSGPELSEAQIPLAQQYLSLHLGIANRHKIVKVLCDRKPDLMTQATREIIPAYMSIIRQLHEAVNLSHTMGDVQAFQADLLKLPVGDLKKEPPSVEDFLRIMRKHSPSLFKFLHEIFSKGPALRDLYKEFAKALAEPFRVNASAGEFGGGGRLTVPLEKILSELSSEQYKEVLAEVSSYEIHTMKLVQESNERAAEVILQSRKEATKADKKAIPHTVSELGPGFIGPGLFLKRWNSLIEETQITPIQQGQARIAGDASVVTAGMDIAGRKVEATSTTSAPADRVPSCAKTIQYLGSAFHRLVVEANENKMMAVPPRYST